MFTQSEIALLKNFLKQQVKLLESIKEFTKEDIQYLWKHCDKNKKVTTEQDFKELNKSKDFLRRINKKHKQYSAILYKLKKVK